MLSLALMLSLAPVAPPSAFYLACLGSGGVPGVLTPGADHVLIRGHEKVRFALSIAPGGGAATLLDPVDIGPTTLPAGSSTLLNVNWATLSSASAPGAEYCMRVLDAVGK